MKWIKPGVSESIPWTIKPDGKYWRALLPEGIKLDLFITTPENWGIIFLIRTGSADFSAALMTYAKLHTCYHVQGGFLCDRDGTQLKTAEEEDVFHILNLQYIEPTKRLDGRAVQKLHPNTSCGRCSARYFDESGCDPCPCCGASYSTQIFPEVK
jgi:hypothetical protein